jgi:hypothetical protein
MGAYLNLTDAERLMEELISQYNQMQQSLTGFKRVVDKNRAMLSDNIMTATDEVIESISNDMKQINKYISEFTGRKLDVVRDITHTETKGGKEIFRIL